MGKPLQNPPAETTRLILWRVGVTLRTIRMYIERGDLEAKSEGEGIEKIYLVSILPKILERYWQVRKSGLPSR